MKPDSKQPKKEEEPLHISIPALPDQQEITNKLDSLFAYADNLQKTGKIDNLTKDKLRKLILDKVFRNDLPENFYHESADITLERLIKELENIIA
jgi:hypothetical protein